MAAPASVIRNDFSSDPSRRAAPDAGGALGELRRKAHALAGEPMNSAERLAALEALRPAAVQATEARRASYCGKPAPLAGAERQAWEDVVALWQSLYFAYALCADAGLDTQTAATVSQRALDSLGCAIEEHAFAYRAVPGTLWKELNACYRSATECSLAEVPVTDPLKKPAETSCKRVFLRTVLHAAANLYAASALQMHVFARWLPQWLEMVDLGPTEPLWASRSPLAIDLAGECSARLARNLGKGDGVRYLDTSALGMHLRSLAESLRTGGAAPEFECVGDAPRPALERLLTHLYVQWCSTGSVLAEERGSQVVRGQAALGMHAIHFQISGRAFRQPGLRYTREEEHDLATFGHITERTEHRLLTGRSAALEPWDLTARGAGTLVMRRQAGLETRVAHGQLVAVRTSSIDPPYLAIVQRLVAEPDGALAIGLRLVRGESRGVAVRSAGDSLQKFERALLLEADAERGVPATLIVDAGRFAPGARIEMHTGRSETLVLGNVFESGHDFDRFVVQPAASCGS